MDEPTSTACHRLVRRQNFFYHGINGLAATRNLLRGSSSTVTSRNIRYVATDSTADQFLTTDSRRYRSQSFSNHLSGYNSKRYLLFIRPHRVAWLGAKMQWG